MAIELSNIKVKTNGAFQNICPYSVGAIYMSLNNISPASLYGGTWERVQGHYLYLSSSNMSSLVGNNTSGQWKPSYSHWHSNGDLVARFDPSYLSGGTNYFVWKYGSSPTGGDWYYTSYNAVSSGYTEHQGSWSFGGNRGIAVEGGTGSTAVTVDFNDIPAFAVFCWYRKS